MYTQQNMVDKSCLFYDLLRSLIICNKMKVPISVIQITPRESPFVLSSFIMYKQLFSLSIANIISRHLLSNWIVY